MLAGCPNPLSLTFATVPFITDIPKLDRDTLNTRIGKGEIVLLKEAGDIRIARGVTSFTEETETKGYAYKKIKTVDTMKLIKNDIRLNLVKNYIGKVPNSYDNKILLCGLISEYLLELSEIQLIEKSFSVSIDFDAQKKFLKETLGDKVNAMTEKEILEANTKDKVFLAITLKLLDSIEDVDIVVNI
nr:phage tail sheath C-terminal domain-containing protein [Romboutsia sp. 1001285H_161024_C4]